MLLNKQDVIKLINEGTELHCDSETKETIIEKDHNIKVEYIGQYDDETTDFDGLEVVDGDIIYKVLEHTK